MTRIILVRHGETQWNLEAKTQGSQDTLLTEKGVFQAKRIAEKLADERVQCIYTSDLKRAYHTAQAIADKLGIGLGVLPALREMNFGCWEGKNIECIKREYADIYRLWVSNPPETCIPDGETLIDVQQRALRETKKLAGESKGHNLVLVSHGITIKVLILGLLGIDLAFLRKLRIDNGSISIIDIKDEGNVLVTLNDTCHLKEGC
ncbi:MAG: Phosphoglycerate mutase [Firmicutes bacterium]|nr:Phosphoglycerate mutase [Bacillota bacterium]MDI6706376.1 histidine phosphatase family protein [Bacillota bacterium]